MSDSSPVDFQRSIYNELDEKLRESEWQSGVAEAHGLLAGLACRGITSAEIGNRMHLLRISGEQEKSMLTGLFELVLRDLESQEPVFNLLLPDDDMPAPRRVEEIADWCGGFMQGFCHDGEHAINTSSPQTREALQDVVEISGMYLDSDDCDSLDNDRSLAEVEEYLRVAVQLIFDEHAGNVTGAKQGSDQIH